MTDATKNAPTAADAKGYLDWGNERYAAKDLQGAAACYRAALRLHPDLTPAHYNLGCTLELISGAADALPHFERAAALEPEWSDAHGKYGLALARVGRMAEAACALQKACDLAPERADYRNNLGLALNALGRGEEAHAAFREAIRLDPLDPAPRSNIAVLLERFGHVAAAIGSCLEALRLRPDFAEAHHNLGTALKAQGRHAEAIAQHREALRLSPGYQDALSSLLFTLLYPAQIPEKEVFAEHAAFGAAHRFPPPVHGNTPSTERVLKLGYVSADFREHAVARFIEPVLKNHDRARFQVFCYSNVTAPDDRSARIAALCDRFVNIAGLSDAQVAKILSRDGIDILIDLSGHSAGNRLSLFARKPAPVQMTWIGYPFSTGLAAIDYRITDAVCDPPGTTERFHTEELIRLPGPFSCFAPPEEAPEVAELPALATRRITFGSFNNPAKITPETVALWSEVLRAVPGSRMLLKGYSLACPETAKGFEEAFAAHGIERERLTLTGNTPSYRDHLALYGEVDIALDTFPYNGTTTTCEALWMGVPVVTLTGASHRARVGASLLCAVGLSELAAGDSGGFVATARALAGDPERLAALRRTLRPTMDAAPLTDGAGFTRSFEDALAGAWERWCHRQERLGSAEGRGADEPGLRYVELLLKKGMREEACDRLRGLARQENTAAGYLLAVLRGDDGFPEEAVGLLLRVLSLEPEHVKALNALGTALRQLRQEEQAEECYRNALGLDPSFQQARINLALLLKEGGRLTEAEEELDRGVACDAASVPLRYNLANVLQAQGRSLDAIEAYRAVLRLDPDHLDARQNMLFALHYTPGFSHRFIFAEHLKAARTRPFRPAPGAPVPASRPQGGRIRIGYVSPDFRQHSVASFIEPVIREHDRALFEVFCYANLPRADRTTERLKGLVEQWRDIHGVPDAQAAAMIAADGIDILVDLAGHTSGNRLPLFALRPAPLQATWIGYPDTTGLKVIDVRITDAIADPPGEGESCHSERLVRLPRVFCCYLPPDAAPPVAPPPCLETGHVTFGSFNNLAKATPEVIALWSRVLHAVPGSGMLVKAQPLGDEGVRRRILALFEAQGIAPGRIELDAGQPTSQEHLAQYRRVDVALDTFPYNGTTTTCEALWMGVPVITLAGDRHASRTGATLLTSCGLADLVTTSEAQYVEMARRVAADTGALASFRGDARQRLERSPLLDAAGVTRELEDVLRDLCAQMRGERE
ncbi:O-linked N-acetylglucosamine transferase, SPINDLY family protein [Geomonas ferrireducens]|uniref:O-linked N-acetylglucosamine transferase, SPINDLY family protein n=1 Tax=Geomonas ferrireducens TaxID=2570227 RepID=UPI001FE7A322|nr:glycosyltransferase family 41 protein [Geomonas ferrireducens]